MIRRKKQGLYVYLFNADPTGRAVHRPGSTMLEGWIANPEKWLGSFRLRTWFINDEMKIDG